MDGWMDGWTEGRRELDSLTLNDQDLSLWTPTYARPLSHCHSPSDSENRDGGMEMEGCWLIEAMQSIDQMFKVFIALKMGKQWSLRHSACVYGEGGRA
jgi:hypothetical protein